MIFTYDCPKCKNKTRKLEPVTSCFWCDGTLQLPMPFTPDVIAQAFPKGYIPPRPGTKESNHE